MARRKKHQHHRAPLVGVKRRKAARLYRSGKTLQQVVRAVGGGSITRVQTALRKERVHIRRRGPKRKKR